MNVINQIEDWGNSHRPGWLDIFRIALGIFITYKGAIFAMNLNSLEMTIEGVNMRYPGRVGIPPELTMIELKRA